LRRSNFEIATICGHDRSIELYADRDAGADNERTDALLCKSCKGRFEIAICSGINNGELQAERARRRLQVCDAGLDIRRGRVRENAERAALGNNS
jgi:hypothetical protein